MNTSAKVRVSIKRIVDLNDNQRRYVKAIERVVGGALRTKTQPHKISKLLEHLYLGSQIDAQDIGMLQSLGITHILNTVDGTFQSETSVEYYDGKFKYLGFQSDDLLNYPIMKHFEETFNFVEDARTSGGKCLIHCISGINRSGALSVGYVMVHNNIGPVSAVRYVLAKRGVILSNHGFIERLVKFSAERNLLLLDAGEIEKMSEKRVVNDS